MRETGKQHSTLGRMPDASASTAFVAAVVVGYGLFRGVNASSYLSAFASVEAPFLFVPDLFFNIVVACAVVACSLAVILLVRSGRLKALSLPFLLPTGLLLAGNVCALLGVFAYLPADAALLVPGLLFGVGSVMLSLVWIEVLAAQRPAAIATQIALSMLVNMVTSSTLSNMSSNAQMAASCLLLVVMAGCAAYVRRRLKRVGVSEDVEIDQDVALAPPPTEAPKGAYRSAFLTIGDSLVAFFVLEAVIGLLNSFMLAGSIQFEGSGTVSVAGTLCGIMAFCIVVFVVQRTPLASTAFGVLVPVIAALLVFLPFLGEWYNLFFSTVLLGSYYFIALLVTYLIAVTARERRVSPYVLMGAASCIARMCLAVALVGGYELGGMQGGLFAEGEDTMRFLVIVVAIVYALSLAAVLVTRGRRRGRVEEARLAAVRAEAGRALSEGGEGAAGEVVVDADQAFDARCAAVALNGGLTEREGELLRYLARGRTNAYIAGVLFVSENTVRSHVRNIYAKLGIHTRQQLIDLVEAERV